MLAAVLVLAILAGAIAGASAAVALANILEADASGTTSTNANAANVAYEPAATASTVAEIAAASADAVVTIEVTTQVSFPGQAASGSGSGFFVTGDGTIVTAYHVIEGATEITVVLADGTETTADVTAVDPDNDVAILDAEGDGYATLTLATNSVTVGETVIAIGNALGEYQTSVTVGVVSGTDRSIEVANGRSLMALDGLIQTDAALASGMSGGPLLNLAGQVVGISTADAENADGIAFAEPVRVAAALLPGVA